MNSVGRGNRNVRTKNYKGLLEKMGAQAAAQAAEAYRLFLENPEHPMLENHALYDSGRGRHRNASRAVSVTYRIRAIYVVDGDTNVWYWIGTHEAYNVFTGNK